MLRENTIRAIEQILSRPGGTLRARDRASTALTELVMAAPEALDPEKLPGGETKPGSGPLAKDKTDDDDAGPRRAKEIDDGAADRSPAPRGGSPKRKGLSTAREQRGVAQGRTRGAGAIGESEGQFKRRRGSHTDEIELTSHGTWIATYYTRKDTWSFDSTRSGSGSGDNAHAVAQWWVYVARKGGNDLALLKRLPTAEPVAVYDGTPGSLARDRQ